MDEPLDLQDVTAFLAVVDTGSFTAAAKRLGLAKSNVSRRVARLEDRLGARLLERTTRRQRLTEVGARYHEHVTGAVSLLAEAARSVSELQGEPRGRLRVTGPSDWNEGMGRVVAEFSARYPEIQIEVELTQRRVDLVAEGFDVALRAGVLEDSSLIARSVGVGEAHLYASPEYLERHGEPGTPDELADHAFVLFRGRQGERQLTLDGPSGSVELMVHGSISAQDFGFVRTAVVAGAGIGGMPDSLAIDELCRGRLQPVLPEYCMARSVFHLVYPSTRFLSPKVRVFLDFCVEWFDAERKRNAVELRRSADEPASPKERRAAAKSRAPGRPGPGKRSRTR